jgi:hypothetical protein
MSIIAHVYIELIKYIEPCYISSINLDLNMFKLKEL